MLFDTMIIGQVCLDTNTDFDGRVENSYGGAVLFSGYAAANMGNQVAALVKCNENTVDIAKAYERCENITIFPLHSRESTRMENTYFTADRERRRQRCNAVIDPYQPSELPDVESHIYHLAGLVKGDIGNDMILACHERGGKVALDVQCLLRCVEPDGSMVFQDWKEKREMLPYIHFLKTDAAEAEILTGLTDRAEAAKILHGWGAKEVMITHNSEVLVYDGTTIYTKPLKPRGLSGRTGRGDTCFAGYITKRLSQDIDTSLTWAAALVSLKMDTPGPFQGGREDVERFIAAHYQD